MLLGLTGFAATGFPVTLYDSGHTAYLTKYLVNSQEWIWDGVAAFTFGGQYIADFSSWSTDGAMVLWWSADGIQANGNIFATQYPIFLEDGTVMYFYDAPGGTLVGQGTWTGTVPGATPTPTPTPVPPVDPAVVQGIKADLDLLVTSSGVFDPVARFEQGFALGMSILLFVILIRIVRLVRVGSGGN